MNLEWADTVAGGMVGLVIGYCLAIAVGTARKVRKAFRSGFRERAPW